MKTHRDRVAGARPRLETILLLLALGMIALLLFVVASFHISDVQKTSETLPISLSSKQVADYSAASDARLPDAGVELIAEVIHDADPDANVRARYSQVLDNLLTPVPGGPPKPTVTPSPSPIPAPASVYVTNIRLEPAEPKQDEPITFYVTFLNTTGAEQTYRWFVFIYHKGQTQPFGQTSSDRQRLIPTGTSEQASVNTWKMGSSDPCVNLEAKVNREETGGRPMFDKPDGQPYVLQFTLCK